MSMKHNKKTLAIASFVVAVALAGVAFATPQQVLAGGHHNHKHNSIKVDQQINQLNNCTLALCQNDANNNVQIHR